MRNMMSVQRRFDRNNKPHESPNSSQPTKVDDKVQQKDCAIHIALPCSNEFRLFFSEDFRTDQHLSKKAEVSFDKFL